MPASSLSAPVSSVAYPRRRLSRRAVPDYLADSPFPSLTEGQKLLAELWGKLGAGVAKCVCNHVGGMGGMVSNFYSFRNSFST